MPAVLLSVKNPLSIPNPGSLHYRFQEHRVSCFLHPEQRVHPSIHDALKSSWCLRLPLWLHGAHLQALQEKVRVHIFVPVQRMSLIFCSGIQHDSKANEQYVTVPPMPEESIDESTTQHKR